MSTELGSRAETIAAVWLQKQGLKLLAQNWRNRWCEIDLVMRDKQKVIHFIEVKYRHSSLYGSGFEYISADKTERLRRAAIAWMQSARKSGDYTIDVIAIEGDLDKPRIDYLENAVTG